MHKNHYVAIMAGGIGSRFWPKSRQNYPKQFLDILNTGKTLIQWTYERFASFIPPENIFVVTSQEYMDIVHEQLPRLPAENILGEPSRKNTAPCIAYISFKLFQKDPMASLIIAPSDHLISDNTSFIKVCLEALSFVAKHRAFITLGIKPANPNTGYGYIQHEQQSVTDNVYKVKTFTEKPNLELAKMFVESGDFLWNSGLFVWRADVILHAFHQYLSDIAEVFDEGADQLGTPQEEEFIGEAYSRCRNISIDYGVMEKADNVYVLPADFGWSDVGTWDSLHRIGERDANNNMVNGDVLLYDTTGCVIKTPSERLVVVQGLEDYIIAEYDNVLLICKRSEE